MKVMVVGGGGREHALVWALAKSPEVEALVCCPGNAGMAEARCVPVAANDIDGVVRLALAEQVGFVVVGPEEPLALGLVDRLEAAGIPAFGPSAAAARIEASKGFMKDLCAGAGIPTARYRRFAALEPALTYLAEVGAPVVVKADGLAAGKGVTVAATLAEAEAAVRDAFGGRFGAAGAELVIEEMLTGQEVSFFALVDGRTALPFGSAQDHKRAFDGDQGPNTGGMGAYSPAPMMTPAVEAEVMARIVSPAVAAMAAAGHPFKGLLFAGLMLTADGPKLIEFNARFGDPETEVVLPRLESDLLAALRAARDGTLDRLAVRWHPWAALTVVMAARGYPGEPKKGGEILLPDRIGGAGDAALVFHAATRRDGGRLLAAGGRVLAVTGIGPDLASARDRAYDAVDRIDWPDGFCRRDIGWRALSPS